MRVGGHDTETLVLTVGWVAMPRIDPLIRQINQRVIKFALVLLRCALTLLQQLEQKRLPHLSSALWMRIIPRG